MADCPKFNESERDKNCFLRRISDKKFYRGAIFWRFTNSWRRAAVLPVSTWRGMFNLVEFLRNSTDEFEFVYLDDVE